MIDILLAPFEYEFMLRAFIVVIVSATLCGIISCWVVLLGWSMLGEAIAHAIFPGVVLSFLFGVPFAIGAFLSGVAAVYLIGHLRNHARIKEDGAMGVVFITMFSLGLVLVSFIPGKGHLVHILFGNLLSVTYLDLYQIVILGVIGMSLLIYRRKDFTLYAFDPGHANVIGISTRSLHNLFLITLSFTVVVSIQQVGVVLVVAMLVIPGVSASLLTRKISRMLVISPIIAITTSVVGLYISYVFDFPPGSVIVLAMGSVFVVVYAITTLLPMLTGARALAKSEARGESGIQKTLQSMHSMTH